MDLDDILPKNPGDPLVLLLKQDLDPMSVEELQARIAALEGEIARAKSKIERAVNHRASADALFKRRLGRVLSVTAAGPVEAVLCRG